MSEAGGTVSYTSERPATGSYEEALEHVGRRGEWVKGDAALSEQMVRMFCAMVEDANPSYWDPTLAREVWGGPVVPPALIQSATLPLPWRPRGMDRKPSLQFAVPLPGPTMINVSTEAVYHRPILVGETLSHQEEIVSISPERMTRLGPGHFITTAFHYADADKRPVATVTNVLLRFGVAEWSGEDA